MWSVMVGGAVVAFGLFYTLLQLNNLRSRSSNSNETQPKLCEVCELPQMGDATGWSELNCGHCYHQHCLNLFATQKCISCEHQMTNLKNS
uniref:RING-type domain-containing protein n=1 Tax=Anopheles christyi TaxID=43041 RepID=A0A182JSI8_9DIPT